MSLEMNKIAASVLTAGVVAMGAGFAAEVLMHPHVPEEPHYTVAVQETEGDGGQAEPQGPKSVLPLLADADVEAGQNATRACQACHSFEKGGPNKVGPHLYGVVGREIAGVEDFSYSDALEGKDGEWTYEKLNHFLHDPQGWASGTKMSYSGIGDVQKRADLIAYMRQNDDSPRALPTEEEIAAVTADAESEAADGEESTDGAGQQADGGDQGGGLAARLQQASADEGEKAARACQACHSFEKGGPNKVGPNIYDVVGADIAAVDGFSYSDVLAGKDGSWTYDKLDAFLENPQGWAKGTRMSYPGIKDPKKRADVIAYLRQQGENPPPLPGGDSAAAEQPSEGDQTTESGQADETEQAAGESDGAASESQQAASGEGSEAQSADGGDEAEAGETQDAKAAGGSEVVQKIAAGSADDGQKAARVCQACHSFEKGGPNKVGPNLYNIVGADIAGVGDFNNYSSALKNKDGAWTYEKLWAYLENPQGWAPGTRMTYPGVKDPKKRADVIQYLRQQADNPPALN